MILLIIYTLSALTCLTAYIDESIGTDRMPYIMDYVLILAPVVNTILAIAIIAKHLRNNHL